MLTPVDPQTLMELLAGLQAAKARPAKVIDTNLLGQWK
jgi:hypothetical protein